MGSVARSVSTPGVTVRARLDTRRSPCPIGATLDLLGDRWSLLILRDLFAGKSLFREFRASPEKIASNILAARLVSLEAAGFIAREAPDDTPHRPRYSLTPLGRSLEPVLWAVTDWGLAHIEGTAARITPPPSSAASIRPEVGKRSD